MHRAEERVPLRHGEAEVRRTRALTGRNALPGDGLQYLQLGVVVR